MTEKQMVKDAEKQAPTPQNQSLNGRLLFAIIASAFGSAFQHGYNTGVVNAPQALIEKWISGVISGRNDGKPTDQTQVTLIWAVAVSIFCVGGMVGGLSTGFVAEKFGRKGGLLVSNALVILSAALQGVSKMYSSYELIIIGRFIIGINSGLNAGLTPMYLAEISPMNLRGSVGTVYQLVVTISILISQILGLDYILGTAELWPVLLALIIAPAIFMFATLPFCPESPKYTLINKKKDIEAERGLQWLRGTIEVHDEMDEMRAENEAMKVIPKVTLREMLSNPMLKTPLGISVMIMLCQQLSGINAVMFFSTKIFNMAGMSNDGAKYATLGMGSLNVIMTLISLFLVELTGRKTLLMIGFSSMFVVTVMLTIALMFVNVSSIVSGLAVVLVMAFVIAFAVGPGSIPWFLVSELFNSSARPLATSIAVGVNWTANFVVGLGFLPLQEMLQSNVFLIFVVLLALFVLYVYKKVPETKNKTLEEIQMGFRQESYK
ncbi:solute carrier family 2, facilitated glucose transporter member 1 isoform X2 [Acyrthosiphon pisum]|uniref:Major facilitator superfamily (MFS) profile domain-containing protein n=1 Tax=Acyrthosiphon pisum TaxID=7029 RepID=A0A8R2A517_ACYPI|nr:solute carrier family 2, facilitated glucose transporter member 1 isoform X2 [Acyrthosiphon pisum]|eukprot:XP_001950963.1 PREDICTED: solute carrier family 2, facilitated glucose transporter member 1 isoform X2 [Acyrthosiphon pisum]